MLFHLIKRGRTYYFRQRIPLDLIQYFPQEDIRKSLKTSNLAAAKILHASWEERFQKAFALLRTGYLSGEQQGGLLSELLPTSCQGRVENKTTLSSLFILYAEDRSPHWTSKTQAEFKNYLSVLLSLLGDKGIKSIERKDCIRCRELLQSLPPNFAKKKQYAGLTPLQVAQANQSAPFLTAKTINKYLTLLSSFFKWSIKQGLIVQNPAEGLLLPINQNAAEERETYSLSEIAAIQTKLPRLTDEPEKYWIPIIAMYSGLRLDEICQLQREDVQRIEDVWCFNVKANNGKRLKTSSSVRIVPLHPELIRLGLVAYVDDVESGSLWSNLRPDKYGRWGHKLGNWYSRFNRREITDNPKKCFHSLRHNVADQLKQNGVSELVIGEILGHKNENISTGRYGKNFNIDALKGAISVIDYSL